MNKRVLEVAERTAWGAAGTEQCQRRERRPEIPVQSARRGISYRRKRKKTGAGWSTECQSTITTTRPTKAQRRTTRF